jgi:uncharacterized protein YbjQ (UPF0145 family)
MENILNENSLNNQNNIYGIKKIDFDEMQRQLEDKNKLKEVKKELIQKVYGSIYISIFFVVLIVLSEILKWGDMATGILFWIFFFSLLPIAKSFFYTFFSKLHLEEKIIYTYYKDNLTIINYVPENIKYELIKLIDTSSNSLENAKDKLIAKAYELKADAIINYTNDVSKASIVEGNRKNVRTKVRTYYEVQGMAIKLI